MMLDVYLFGAILTGISLVFASVYYLAGTWDDARHDGSRRQAARETLVCVTAFPFAVALWPLTLLVTAVFWIGYLLRVAELPPYHRRADPEKIARLERELERWGWHD